jgi:hypothetical protein
MKKALLILVTTMTVAIAPIANAQTDLLSLSDPAAFGGVVATTFTGLGAQTSSGFVYNGTVNFGDNVFGQLASAQDWSSQVGPGIVFTLFMSVSGTNPDIPFSLEFFDSAFASIDIWEGTTVGLTATPVYNNLSIITPGSGNYSDVGSFVLTWNGGGAETLDSTVSNIAVVPEPSTYALLALSGLALGGYAMRRRRRA